MPPVRFQKYSMRNGQALALYTANLDDPPTSTSRIDSLSTKPSASPVHSVAQNFWEESKLGRMFRFTGFAVLTVS